MRETTFGVTEEWAPENEAVYQRPPTPSELQSQGAMDHDACPWESNYTHPEPTLILKELFQSIGCAYNTFKT